MQVISDFFFPHLFALVAMSVYAGTRTHSQIIIRPLAHVLINQMLF